MSWLGQTLNKAEKARPRKSARAQNVAWFAQRGSAGLTSMQMQRWTWDLKKIADQEISESVLVLLVEEMKRLPSDLQLGLKVASCLGSCAQKNVLEILSRDVDMDLIDILQQVSEMGFMSIEDDGLMFSFAHDKIQQAGK